MLTERQQQTIHDIVWAVFVLAVALWMMTIPDGTYILSNDFRRDLPAEVNHAIQMLTHNDATH